MRKIQVFNTYISPDAANKVTEVLTSTFVSEGKLVKEFETKLEKNLGLCNAVAVNSGTAALHLALVVAGIGEGDEVILPAQTFVATGLVILQQKAIPVFADIDYETGNISVDSIKQKITGKTKAIIPVHWGGYPCDMDKIKVLAAEYNLIVIEDAAHALGAIYRNRFIGSISDFTCFSFQAIKHLTTGDGGAVATLSHNTADQLFIQRWFGIDRNNAKPSILGERQYDISSIGFKYHLNDYAAALGLANLYSFDERLKNRRELAAIYAEELSKIAGIKLFKYENDRQSSYWLFGLHVENREDFITALSHKGITASVVHQRIDRNSVFDNSNKDLPNQEVFDKTQIHIPIHDAMSKEDIEYVVDSIKRGW